MIAWLRPRPASAAHAAREPVPAYGRTDLSPRAEQRLRRLEWTVIKRLDGLLLGDWRTLMRGSGLDLTDLREYQPHDDVRHIDWNLTARLQQPHVRVFSQDREMAAWFLLDLSPSVDFGSGARRKRDVLADLVAVLARLFTRRGNRVGALLYGSGVEPLVPARSSRAHVLQLMHRIQQRPTGTAEPGATRLAELLQAAGQAVRRRSTVFVVSDFISEPGWEAPLGRLTQRHDVVAVRLTDPLEQQLPDLGLLPLRDAESGEQLMVDTHDRAFRRRFAALAAEREAAVREALARAGVDALELSTDDDLAAALLRFAALRRQRARLAAGGGAPTAHSKAQAGAQAT